MAGSILVTENGPYIVRGDVPIYERTIVCENGVYGWSEKKQISHGEVYALCRCGHSRTPPFCDTKSHKRFRAKNRADSRTFDERCVTTEGPGVVLKDDERCSLSRLCHRPLGKPWKLLPESDSPEKAEEILEACRLCPSGRLLAIMNGEPMDFSPEPEIWIIQDPEKRVSGGICVRGFIPISSYDGTVYEPRASAVLCRCGRSGDMPFCDASHINSMYRDDR